MSTLKKNGKHWWQWKDMVTQKKQFLQLTSFMRSIACFKHNISFCVFFFNRITFCATPLAAGKRFNSSVELSSREMHFSNIRCFILRIVKGWNKERRSLSHYAWGAVVEYNQLLFKVDLKFEISSEWYLRFCISSQNRISTHCQLKKNHRTHSCKFRCCAFHEIARVVLPSDMRFLTLCIAVTKCLLVFDTLWFGNVPSTL